jgi:hypothetical protein
MRIDLNTGNQDPNKDTRIFLGIVGPTGREFRLRKGNDANPFRENSNVSLIFGVGADYSRKSPYFG